jgi:solute carrier family 13 (sodium-dependent dicarboxylate transporter), member 2/3/5
MALGVPLSAVFLVIAWVVLTRFAFPSDVPAIAEGKQVIRRQLDELGQTTPGEWLVLGVFVLTAALWVGHGPIAEIESVVEAVPFVTYLSDEAIAIGAAILLLTLPVPGRRGEAALPWNAAQKSLPWGVLL